MVKTPTNGLNNESQPTVETGQIYTLVWYKGGFPFCKKIKIFKFKLKNYKYFILNKKNTK